MPLYTIDKLALTIAYLEQALPIPKLEHYNGAITIMKIKFVNKKQFANYSGAEQADIMRLTAFESQYQTVDKGYMVNHIAIPALGEYEYEIFTADMTSYERDNGIEIAHNGTYTMLRIVAEEETTLYQAGYDVYEKLFAYMAEHVNGNLVRIWNYVPDILADDRPDIPESDRERYRQFNAGRNDAWRNHGPTTNDGQLHLPAATGIGSHNGPLVIECLISTNPVQYIENPRQIPAYRYPAKYGSKPPVFARGTLVENEDFSELYISGTASIVGSETTYIGDPIQQVRETFINIQTLISKQNLERYNHPGFELDTIEGLRVYIKEPRDYVTIRSEVEAIYGTAKPVIYLNDNICRPNLLLEIEGVAQLVNGESNEENNEQA